MNEIFLIVLIIYWAFLLYFSGIFEAIREKGIEKFSRDLKDGFVYLVKNPFEVFPWMLFTTFFVALATPFVWLYSKLKSKIGSDTS